MKVFIIKLHPILVYAYLNLYALFIFLHKQNSLPASFNAFLLGYSDDHKAFSYLTKCVFLEHIPFYSLHPNSLITHVSYHIFQTHPHLLKIERSMSNVQDHHLPWLLLQITLHPRHWASASLHNHQQQLYCIKTTHISKPPDRFGFHALFTIDFVPFPPIHRLLRNPIGKMLWQRSHLRLRLTILGILFYGLTMG